MKRTSAYGTRSVPWSSPKVTNTSIPQVFTYPAPASLTTYTGESGFIESFTGSNAKFRDCTHSVRTMEVVSNGETLRHDYVPASGPITVWWTGAAQHAARSALSSLTTKMVPGNPSPLNVDWNALNAQALAIMMPSLNEGDSFLRYLIELKDFKRLGSSLLSKADALLNTGKPMFIPSSVRLKNRTSLRKKASNAYLSYMFAWRPLITEALSLMKAAADFKSRVDAYVKRAGSPQQRYYGINLATPAFSSNVTVANGILTHGPTYLGLTPKTKWEVVETEAKPIRYSATLRYRYTFPPDLIEKARGMLGFSDVIGTKLNIADVWELFPFTFLVDWVVNIGQYLDRLRVDNIDLKSRTEILDFCSSVKGERRYLARLQPYYTNGSSWFATNQPWHNVGFGREKYYMRRVSTPNMYTALTTSGLSGNEMLLAGALVSQRYGK